MLLDLIISGTKVNRAAFYKVSLNGIEYNLDKDQLGAVARKFKIDTGIIKGKFGDPTNNFIIRSMLFQTDETANAIKDSLNC